ncbi:class I SAM-dependent methyltransferase [Sphaerisporangium sp. B11E5]|uniref:class I SAM-dependent methyltransferase n=1 Tax=Sphaerisporangium sp. B11E5 TaxID=3153563 RepID=UPI00325E177B
MGRVATARRWARHSGIRPVAEVTGSWLATRFAPGWVRRNTAPALHDFVSCGGPLASTAPVFLERLGWPAAEIQPLLREYEDVALRIAERYEATELAFPQRFGVEAETGFFVYAATRLLAPEVVVETGIADGRSSFFFLSALERNGKGTLHSFDINPRAGRLVGDHDRWRRRIVDRAAPEAAFVAALRGLGGVDFFFHDSDHRYLGQMLEYENTWPLMRADGLFASDDADVSRAFIDFCQARGRRPCFLFDNRKITGALRT